MEKLREDEMAEMRNIFDILDVDGSGSISARQLQAMMIQFGYEHSEEDIQCLIDAVVTDGSGKLNYVKFCAVVRWQSDDKDAT